MKASLFKFLFFNLSFVFFAGCSAAGGKKKSLALKIYQEINYQEKGEICQPLSEAPKGKEPLCFTVEVKKPILNLIEEKAAKVEKIASMAKKSARKARKIKEGITGRK